jgi:dTDP-4-amino-4,6-dideoxygalactose transaminase
MVEGYDTRTLGLNLRLPEISAAIAMVQMEKLPEMLNLRRKNAESISINLRPMTKTLKISLPKEPTSRSFNWYLYTLSFEDSALRQKVKEEMLNHGIGATVYYDPPVHKTPYYRHMAVDSYKNGNGYLSKTEWSSEHVLSLPVHPFVTEQDIGKMVNVFKEME